MRVAAACALPAVSALRAMVQEERLLLDVEGAGAGMVVVEAVSRKASFPCAAVATQRQLFRYAATSGHVGVYVCGAEGTKYIVLSFSGWRAQCAGT